MPEVQRQLDEARELLQKVDERSSQILRALNRYRVVLAITAVLLLAVGLLGWTTYRSAQCNQSWANRYTSRASLLTDLSTPRQNALDKLLRDALVANPDRAQLVVDAKAYTDASNAYQKALRVHPIPPSPANHCTAF